MTQIKDKNGDEIQLGDRVCVRLSGLQDITGIVSYLPSRKEYVLSVSRNDFFTFRQLLTDDADVVILQRHDDDAKNATTEEELQEIEENDIDIETLFDDLSDVEVEGGFDCENDDSCPDGACKI